MEKDPLSFKDYAWQGIDSALRLGAKARDSLLAGTHRAVERLDAWQLENKLNRLYAKLGRLSYERLAKNLDVSRSEVDALSLVSEITLIEEEIALRKSTNQFEVNDEKKT